MGSCLRQSRDMLAVNASRLTQLRVSQPSPFGMSRVCIHRQSGPQDAAQVFLTMRSPRPKAGAAEPEERLLRIVGGKTERPISQCAIVVRTIGKCPGLPQACYSPISARARSFRSWHAMARRSNVFPCGG